MEPKPSTIQSLIPAIVAGLVSGLLTIVVSISFAAIVFRGDLVMFLPQGIGIVLFTTMIVCGVLSITSRFIGAMSSTQDAGIVVVALGAAHIAEKANDPTAPSTFITILMFIAISTFVTGLFLFVIGRFQLGNLIRFIPYPVIGGFLAAVGVILVEGTFGIVAAHNLRGDAVSNLFTEDTLPRWLLAVMFAVILIVATRVQSHYLTLPLVLVGGTLSFLVAVPLLGYTIDEALRDGWLLGPFPEDVAWEPIFTQDLNLVQWDLLFGDIWHVPSIALVSAIALLLNVSAIEVQEDAQCDVNVELQQAGGANMLVSLFGGFVGFHSITLTMMSWEMNGKSRLAGLTLSALFLAVLVLGLSMIAYFPKFVLGGFLLFLAFSIFNEWVFGGGAKMPRQDYIVMVAILVLVAFVGYLEGVGFGVLLTAILFTFNYSRVGIIKDVLTGETYQSVVDRDHLAQDILQQHGERLTVYRLSGFIFFGSANGLIERILPEQEHTTVEHTHYVIIDFSQVISLDSSAVMSLARLRQLLANRDVTLIFCGLTPILREQFERSVFDLQTQENFSVFPVLDEAVEWYEEQILQQSTKRKTELIYFTDVVEQFQTLFPAFEHHQTLMNYMERMDVATGDYLAREGEQSSELFWVESGRLQAQLGHGDGDRYKRVRVADAGTAMGEISFYTNHVRTASIVAAEPSVIYKLSQAQLLQMEKDYPEVALAFHRIMVELIAYRLRGDTMLKRNQA